MPYIGVICAVAALFGWGISDFFAQRGIRRIGVWKALLIGDMTGVVAFLPFIWKELFAVSQQEIVLLFISGIIYTAASFFYFSGLGKGKMASVEPLNGLEILLTVILGITIGKEHLSIIQFFLIAVVLIGIILAVTIHHSHLHYHKRILEKGVMLAAIGALGMATTNFFVGRSSQMISPLLIVWFIHAAISLYCLVYILSQRQFKSLFSISKDTTGLLVSYGLLNNAGWIGFALATLFIPISIATTISEGYIALAVLMGIFINKEKLQRHQKAGVALAIIGMIFLSLVSSQ